jgi:fimbrial chaperone protein
MKHLLRVGALAVLAATLGSASKAGDFSVTPVRIFMTPRDRAIAVTVVNEGNEDLVMQAELYTWKQKPGGEDDLVPTEDMILSPPIIKLAAKSRQVVRLARLSTQPVTEQLTYRMIVREVPEAKPPTSDLKLQIALAFSLPVFITPPSAKMTINCTLDKTDTLVANCSNSGTAYAQIRQVSVLRGGDSLARFEGGSYILPGIRRTLALKADRLPSPGPAKLEVTFDDGKPLIFDVMLP